MKQINKDRIILFIYSITNIFSSLWPILYPYIASYIKHYNPSITMKNVFATTIGIFIGRIIGGFFLPNLYFFFGIRGTMQIGGLLLFINYILYFELTSLTGLFFNNLFAGVNYQISFLSVTFFLSEKYTNGLLYVNYVYIGSSLGIIFWGIVSIYIINPRNGGMILEIKENGIIENYFPFEMIHNFKFFMIVIACFSLLFVLPTFFLEDPENIYPNFFSYFKALFARDKKKLNLLNQSFQDVSFNTIRSFEKKKKPSFIKIIDEEEEIFLQKYELTFEEADKKSKKIIFNPLFILFVFLMAIRFSPVIYMVDNYKIIAYKVLKNDNMISLALSTSCFMSIFGQIMVGFLWRKLDFYKSQLFLYFIIFANLFVFVFFAEGNVFVMFWILSFDRIIVRISYGFAALSKFGLFHPKIAVGITKAFDCYNIFSLFIIIGLNYYFDSFFILWFLLVINGVGVTIFFVFFRKFKEIVKNIEKES